MKVIVFLAEGFEEVEALTTVDYLRRKGIVVDTVSITSDKGRLWCPPSNSPCR